MNMLAQLTAEKAESAVLKKLVATFNTLYGNRLNTVISGGAEEPLYQPVNHEQTCNTIYFTRDYLASALHEIAHWCLAGEMRRQQVDYGYWYAPDGRNTEQQALFEQVEVKPQAIEWILSVSCGQAFRLSSDNLEGGAEPSEHFRKNVCMQAKRYCSGGLPIHARELVDAFTHAFAQPSPLVAAKYHEAALP